jgi:DNA-binding GntR family transcriptional regulator
MRERDFTPERLSDQVAAFLRSRIYRGDLQPGQRLLELDLCEELGVSRAPLREAFLKLEREGFVEVRPHRGATVTRFTKHDLHEITELRAVLEGLAARLAAERRDPESIERLRHALAEMHKAAEQGDGLAAAVAHIEFHRSIGRASGMGRLVGFLDQLALQSLQLHGYADLTSEQLLGLASSHDELVTVIESGTADAAEAALVSHITGLSQPIRDYLAQEMTATQERVPKQSRRRGAR